MTNGVPRLLTVNEVATRLRLAPDTVRGLIAGGTLPAVDVAARRGIAHKARWRIHEVDLAAFLACRRAGPAPVAPRQRRRTPAEIIDYYPVGS